MAQEPTPSSSFGERRGHRLAPLNTNFDRPAAAPATKSQSRSRPRPSDYPTTNGSEGPVPLQSPVRRQSSKSSLRSLFSRDKSSRAAAVPDTKLAEIEESQPPPVQSIQPIVPDPEALLSSDLTSPHTAPTTPTTITSPTTPRARATLKTARPRPAESNPPPSREQYGWKPPPLFQAYPQSTKHGCLTAPAMSADAILRLHATTGKSAVEDARNQVGQEDAKKKEQRERKHLRTLSGTINKVEWTNKIYVLATTGFILQYAGEGKHDRLPEKMLQLGPKSVAFASDAIPGKHWVVQVSQTSTSDSVPDAESSKPKLSSRFGFHRSHARRLARSFLLVFDNPDPMIAWLMAIRAEIESRGGPKFITEKYSDDDADAPQLRSKSSVRQMVKKDPHRISSLFLQPQTLRSPEDEDDGNSVGGLTWQSRRSSYVSVSRSMVNSRTGSASTGKTEATGPTNGNGSEGPSFAMTGPPMNPPHSPPVGNGVAVLEELKRPDIDPPYTRSPPSSSQEKRQSLYGSSKGQAIPAPIHPEPAQSNYFQSSIPETLVRSASPPAPNFSVPLFSKKFASRPAVSSISQVAATSPPSVAGVLRRGESTGDFSTSSIASPPQSPTYSIASSRQTDSSEPPFVALDGTRRTLRASNSEDALSRVIRQAPEHGNAFARMARPTAPSDVSCPSSRPLSFVGRSGLGIQMVSESDVLSIPPVEPTPRNRVSTAQIDYQNVSRRKSMPGLSLGPPAAPPPNCPLPKIPSPIAAQALPSWSTSPPVNRFYQSQQISDQVRDNRKNGVSNGIPEQPAQSGARTAARQSRMI
ncbi:uncharacterized protein N7484_005139 [Penicillium longicatenatum]|uniref:uncharacterized protein n=1 Tax=Penicillium longicatenatum TaxID=1561947 RepID=UPI002548ED63|nr:uncharacterized protein N7484_005139 [Penicillium longicatenatum]KAJ5651416.1 hypothetical protein N7484_005139 [Penicillium longicatenatum]